MREIDFFNNSFNFDKNISLKAVHLLRESAQYFISLPTEIIREIVYMLAFKKKGYYYNIQDTHQYPLKINKYLGKYIGGRNSSVEVSYNGWTNNFNEIVTLGHLTYLTKQDIPLYHLGDYLDIKTPLGIGWCVGLIWNIKIVNNEQFLTIIYKIKKEKKIMIAKDIPIYYKYICPMSRHTKYWESVIPTDFAHFLKKIPISQRPIQWARHLATRKNYTVHEYTPL